MTDLEKLKEAFEKWLKDPHIMFTIVMGGPDEVAELFWPFVEHVLNDPQKSMQRTALINNLKYKLGMKLMAHEMVGVELKSQGPVK